MRFQTEQECEQWCLDRGHLPPSRMRGRQWPDRYVCHDFSLPKDAQARVSLCRTLWSVSGDFVTGERLLWLDEWGVWPSGEHPALFTTWRAAFGETRSLMEAPGHLVEPHQDADGLSVLVVASLFLWDCWMYLETGLIVMISHDEVGLVLEDKSGEQSSARSCLANAGVLES
jgi:hypothetical protein